MIATVVAKRTDTMAAEGFASGFQDTTINAFAKKDIDLTTITCPLAKASESRMPVTAGSPSLLTSYPSFMSVFGDGAGERPERAGGDAGVMNPPNRVTNLAKRPSPSSHFSPSMLRRDSGSTFESADSSPTTTISTLDSSLTEPSPSSSPESPTSLLPHSSKKPFAINTKAIRNFVNQQDQYSNSLAMLPGLNRADSPNKKMRNTKNLFVNTSASFRQANLLPKLAVSTVPAHVNGHPFSAPPTPSFIVPPKMARRQPSNLGLTLSTSDSNSTSQTTQERSNSIPETPADPNIRTLRYSHLTSNVPIFSPTLAPEGGMRLPPFGNHSGLSRLGKAGPPLNTQQKCQNDCLTSSPTTVQTLDHVQEESDYELPLSREAKSPAYPQGPVCIYDPFVYLYLEPSDTEASEFDVILNVAREVKNPFSVVTEKATLPQVEDAALQFSLGSGSTFFAGRDSISEPQTAISDKSFSAAFEALPENANRRNSSATAPSKAVPEYIHIPWDHNTNVVDDLLRLCELIDDRVRQQKKVLIHCQCGVSRSASLVVAYGLYKNPDLTVQEAYNAVKNRSRWIGPNMSLIYQLSEFKTNIQRNSPPGWRNPASGWTLRETLRETIGTAKLQAGMEASMVRNSQKGPSTAPFQEDRSPQHGRAKSIGPPDRSQTIVTSSVPGDITPGPSSAPPDMLWSPSAGAVAPNVDSNAMDEKPDSIPPPKAMDIDNDGLPPPDAVSQAATCEPAPSLPTPEPIYAHPSEPSYAPPPAPTYAPPPPPTYAPPPPPTSFIIPQPHPAGFSSLAARRRLQRRIPLHQQPALFTPPTSHAMFDHVPQTPSLLSPRAAEFMASPFHRTVAGDLAGSSIFEQGLLSPKDDDPRSPAQRGEAPITRNIFGVF